MAETKAEREKREARESLDPNAQVKTLDTSGTAAVSVGEQMEHLTPALMDEYGHTEELDRLATSEPQTTESIAQAQTEGQDKPEAVATDEDRPGGNASEDDWRTYRLANGYTEEDLEGMGRNDLRDLKDR